jgi:hypothetical protein
MAFRLMRLVMTVGDAAAASKLTKIATELVTATDFFATAAVITATEMILVITLVSTGTILRLSGEY